MSQQSREETAKMTPTPITEPTVSINLDAQWLRDFARQRLSPQDWGAQAGPFDTRVLQRLLVIATHIEGLEERAGAAPGRTFADGVMEGQRRVMARSNVLASATRELSVADGETLVRAIPLGERALKPRRAPREVIDATRSLNIRSAKRQKLFLEDL